MALRNFFETLRRAHYLGDALAANVAASNTTSETTILASQLPRLNGDIHVGLNFFFDVYGVLTTIDAGTGNDLDFAVRYGSTDIVQIEANSLGTNASIVPWHFHCGGRIHTRGSSGKIVAVSQLWVGQATSLFFSAATAAAGESITLNASNTFNLTMMWGTANAQNVCTAMAGQLRFAEGV